MRVRYLVGFVLVCIALATPVWSRPPSPTAYPNVAVTDGCRNELQTLATGSSEVSWTAILYGGSLDLSDPTCGTSDATLLSPKPPSVDCITYPNDPRCADKKPVHLESN